MSKSTPNFYLFHGEDSLGIEEAVKKIKQGMGENADLNTTEFDGEVASVPEIINAVTSYPFLSDKRLVIVRNLIGYNTRSGAGETGKKAIEQLMDDLPVLPDYARLVMYEGGELRGNSKFLNFAEKQENGFVRKYEAEKNPIGWIMARAEREYGVEIEPQAAQALASVIGDDMRRADNELAKLVAYADGRPITEEDVATLTPYVAETNVFKMVDALAAGRGKLAMRMLHRALMDEIPKSGEMGATLRMFGLITRQFRNLIIAKEVAEHGGNASELAKLAKVPPFAAQNLLNQARPFSMEELEGIYRLMQRYDQDMKVGKIPPMLALDLLVSRLSME